jgi:hypothetical protein
MKIKTRFLLFKSNSAVKKAPKPDVTGEEEGKWC